MEPAGSGAPLVRLPTRVDRRLRLGPFPSASDALKFVCYAAAGAVVGPLVSPFAWVPVLVIGFVVSSWRPDGEAWDERAGKWLLFVLHRARDRVLMPLSSTYRVRGPVAELASGRRVAVVRTGGLPLAYRPPSDLASMFERFKEFLRSTDDVWVLRASSTPLRESAVLPGPIEARDPERAAREGYSELVSVLCRRRRRRRVEIAIGIASAGPAAEQGLVDRAQTVVDQLAGLGLEAHVLYDRGLKDSVRSFGWSLGRTRS